MLTYLLSKVSNAKRIQNSVQTSKMEHIVKIVIFLINSVLDVRLGSEYASEIFFLLVFFGLVIHSTNFLYSIYYSEAVVQRCFVKNLFWTFFWKFTGKHTPWSVILVLKSQHSTVDVFLWVFRKFSEQFFCRIPLGFRTPLNFFFWLLMRSLQKFLKLYRD